MTETSRLSNLNLYRAAWRAALTLANNICVQEFAREDDQDGDRGWIAGTAKCAGRIREWLMPTDEQLEDMLREAGVLSEETAARIWPERRPIAGRSSKPIAYETAGLTRARYNGRDFYGERASEMAELSYLRDWKRWAEQEIPCLMGNDPAAVLAQAASTVSAVLDKTGRKEAAQTERIPCDVAVAPGTVFAAGCDLSLVLAAIRQRTGIKPAPCFRVMPPHTLADVAELIVVAPDVAGLQDPKRSGVWMRVTIEELESIVRRRLAEETTTPQGADPQTGARAE
jgi:hypothetical protein